MEQFKLEDVEALTLKYHAEKVRAQQLAVRLAQADLAAAQKAQRTAQDNIVAKYSEGGRYTVQTLDPDALSGTRIDEAVAKV